MKLAAAWKRYGVDSDREVYVEWIAIRPVHCSKRRNACYMSRDICNGSPPYPYRILHQIHAKKPCCPESISKGVLPVFQELLQRPSLIVALDHSAPFQWPLERCDSHGLLSWVHYEASAGWLNFLNRCLAEVSISNVSYNILHKLFNHTPKVGGMAHWVKEIPVINPDIATYLLNSDFYICAQTDNRGQPFHFEVVLPP